jgi:Fe-S-cluster containining protein
LSTDLGQYRELRARVDAKFDEIRSHYPKEFECRLGCHSCCKPALTVNAIERASLAQFLRERPALVEELRALEKENPHKGKRCSMLSAAGECRVYEARPMVCRSHGAPLQFRMPEPSAPDENARARDVCPLNFTHVSLADVPATDVLNLDTLNTLLALLTQRAFPGDESRTPLRVDALLDRA